MYTTIIVITNKNINCINIKYNDVNIYLNKGINFKRINYNSNNNTVIPINGLKGRTCKYTNTEYMPKLHYYIPIYINDCDTCKRYKPKSICVNNDLCNEIYYDLSNCEYLSLNNYFLDLPEDSAFKYLLRLQYLLGYHFSGINTIFLYRDTLHLLIFIMENLNENPLFNLLLVNKKYKNIVEYINTVNVKYGTVYTYEAYTEFQKLAYQLLGIKYKRLVDIHTINDVSNIDVIHIRCICKIEKNKNITYLLSDTLNLFEILYLRIHAYNNKNKIYKMIDT